MAAVSLAPYDPAAMVPPYLQRLPSIWAGSFAAACVLAGCGGAAAPTASSPESMALDARLTELQQENQELRAQLARTIRDENSPDTCRTLGEGQGSGGRAAASRAAEDQESGQAAERPTLRVVKLVPPGAAPAEPGARPVGDEPVSASALETAPEGQGADDEAPRPVLRLRGNEEPKLQPLDDAVTKLAPPEPSRKKP